MDAAVLRDLNRVGELDELTRGGLWINERACGDEFTNEVLRRAGTD